MNAQSRLLEEALMRHGLPYVVVGGVGFYERKEVKDLLAYLRLIRNPADPIALRRVLNVPPRGIGARTVEEVDRAAAERQHLVLGRRWPRSRTRRSCPRAPPSPCAASAT